jgi:hypothetical protein
MGPVSVSAFHRPASTKKLCSRVDLAALGMKRVVIYLNSVLWI